MHPDPLAELRDWHLPEPLPWWPPAPGWWMLAMLALASLVLILGRALRRRRGLDPKRAARLELDRLKQTLAADGDRRRHLAALSQLLRRLALVYYPRAEVAALTGEDWLDFLDRTGGGGDFSQGVGRPLADAAYRPTVGDDLDLQALYRLIERWIDRQSRRSNLAQMEQR